MGGAASDALTLVRREVLAALLGWQPDPMVEPLEYGDGSVLRFSAGMVWWQDSYFTAWHTRAMPS